DRHLRSAARALRALFAVGTETAGRFLPLFDYHLLLAPFFGDLSVDSDPVPALRDRHRIQPPLRPGRAEAALLHLAPVRAATQPAATGAGAAAPQPPRRCAFGR